MSEYKIITQEKEHGYVIQGSDVCFEIAIASEAGVRKVSSVSAYVNAEDDDAVDINRDDALKAAQFVKQIDSDLILGELVRGGWDQPENEHSELGWWQTA
ncbi:MULTISPECIES: hypothetical protein [unclassified Oleiphilus]|uniref:hypothetical protein n=1 Tax=unclassified Oleiphilus TaxID=2631174 RepID=UPI0007C2CD23|nr:MULTISPECIES: hypothetical protein [unclassified Oleiphilus]KZY68382.1 hypothetical protein A3738_27075 [Oleiphilus sp. HI0066]KZY71751.1 hypothetical protein A3738_03590 [Oleiphilus sp. HI0066]KZY71875.1 hypothetical protein A3739_16480 [Oleiphilus sp. HI0067]KZY71896.1 hypothetical protein A3739_16470 [Oleiphilus sp. HI0067]